MMLLNSNTKSEDVRIKGCVPGYGYVTYLPKNITNFSYTDYLSYFVFIYITKISVLPTTTWITLCILWYLWQIYSVQLIWMSVHFVATLNRIYQKDSRRHRRLSIADVAGKKSLNY